MRLRELRVRGFAQLRGRVPLEAPQGSVALLLAANESGKSTLAAAIRAALYGLDADRRRARGRRTERERYRPWRGGPYGLSLLLEHRGRELLIDRDFEQNSVRVLSGGKDISQEFQLQGELRVGDILTGLSRSQFELSCFVGQGDVVLGDAAELGEALQRIAAGEGSESTAARAIEVLDAALDQYEGLTLKQRGQVRTEIKRCADEVASCERALEQLEGERHAIGAKIDQLAQDSQRRELFEHRREMLRVRRRRAELAQLWRQQDEHRELAERVEAMAAQVERERSLRAMDPQAVQQLLAARDALAAERRSRQEREDALREADRRHEECEARYAALELRRRPLEEDREALVRARQKLEDARLRRRELQAEIDGESDVLRQRGFSLEDAERLADLFGDLPDDDRQRILSRGHGDLQLRQRKDECSEEIAVLRRRRAEIRQRQQLRKRFGIWCLVVGMLPVMVAITMAPHLPFSPWLLYGAGALLGVIGIGSFVSGQSVGRREDEAIKPQLARLREEQTRCQQQLEQAIESWYELAARIGLSGNELEERHRQWLLVDRSVDTIGRLRARMSQVAQHEEQALDGLEPVWELFGAPAEPEQLDERRRSVVVALDVVRELDAADALRRDAQRRADEARARLRSRESEIRKAFLALGIELSAEEQLQTGYEVLRRKLESAEAAGERHDKQLPELQRRLGVLGDIGRLRERIARLQGELEQEEATLRQRAARGGDFAFDEEVLGRELSAEAFDRELQRLDRQEREERGADEGERGEAQTFLARYEKEAPELRERLERHRAAMQRAEEFTAAVELARDTLQEIAHATHRDWSVELNRELGEILEGLGSDISEAVLDDGLQLRISQAGQALRGVEAQQHLSAGAQDTLYLAVRVALSRALGRSGGGIPLVLDDPFANADDERLIRGLSLLIERIAPEQQVLLMACQGSRYAWARHRLPDAAALHAIALDDPDALQEKP